VRRLAPLLVTQRRRLAWAVVAALAAMLAQIAIPRVVMWGVDRALIDQTAALGPFVALLVALALARGVFTFAYRNGLYGVAYRLEYQLRTLIHQHLSGLSFSFYDRVQSGQLISRANADIRSVQMFAAFAPIMAVQALALVAALAVMLSIDVRLTLAAVAALPGVYVLGQRLRDLIFPLSWIVQSRMAEVATVVDENINGVRVVRSFAAEERELSKLARAAQRLRWIAVVQNDARARYGPLIENLPRVSLAVVLAYGGWLAIDGQVTVGALVAFSQYVVLLAAPFRFLGFLLMMGQRAKASAGRIFEVLDERPQVTDRPGAIALDRARGEVAFDRVRFGYGADGAPILDGVDLVVPAGQTVALVGRTGSGKSTVARLLLRFYDVDAGVVRLDGHDVRDLTQESLRRAVGIVPDEAFLFSASVHDNIAYARPDADRGEVERAARAAGAHEFIVELERGYDAVVGERGYDLSGGQRQRLAIARALLADPAVLILDDATSAIDVRVEARIHGALTELLAGRTTIVIAHRLSTIGLADRVVLLEGGRVVADGEHRDLLAGEPRYREVLATMADEDPDGAVLDRAGGELGAEVTRGGEGRR
jgi:ATP-binding cassette, subfamily B, bacterial